MNGDLTSLASKIGRATRTGAVPNDNPFIDGAGPNNDYIWARGFRNPFTLTFQRKQVPTLVQYCREPVGAGVFALQRQSLRMEYL